MRSVIASKIIPGGWFGRLDAQPFPPAIFRLLPGGPAATLQGAGQLGGSFGETLTCTRATAKHVVNGSGVLTALTSNQPGVEAKGLLVEAAATNLVLRSAEFDSASWSKTGFNGATAPTVTANTSDVTDPAGGNTAEKIVFPATTTAGTASTVNQGFTATAAAYSQSLWLRTASGTARVYLHITNGSTWHNTECTVTTTWQRFEVLNKTLTAATWFYALGFDLRSGSGQTGEVSSQTIYAWGAQVELGSFASSYIATAGTSATRNADVVAVPTTGWPVTAGTIEANYTPQETTVAGGSYRFLLDWTGTGRLAIARAGSFLEVLTHAGSTQTAATSGALTWTAGTTYRIRVVWRSGEVDVYRDDVLVASSTSMNTPTTGMDATAHFGNEGGTTNFAKGHISNFAVRR